MKSIQYCALLFALIICVIVLSGSTRAEIDTQQVAFNPDPKQNGDQFPFLSWELHPDIDKQLLFTSGEVVKWKISWNVEFIDSVETMINNGETSMTLVSLQFLWEPRETELTCRGMADGATVDYALIYDTLSRFGPGINASVSLDNWPQPLRKTNRLKFQCVFTFRTEYSTSNTPLFSQFSSAKVALPIYDFEAKIPRITVTTSRISLIRSRSQSHVQQLLQDLNLYDDYGAEMVDEPVDEPGVEAIPLDGRAYSIDITVDTYALGYSFFDLTTRSLPRDPDNYDYPHAETAGPFFIIPGSIKCPEFNKKIDSELLDFLAITDQSGNPTRVIRFYIQETGRFTCTALVVATDLILPSYTAEAQVLIGFSQTVATEPPQWWSIVDDTGLKPSGLVSIVHFPIQGVYTPLFGNTLDLPATAQAFDYTIWDNDPFPADFATPSAQINEYQLLEKVTWSMQQNAQDPNQIDITFSGPTLPAALLTNAAIMIKPFNLAGHSSGTQFMTTIYNPAATYLGDLLVFTPETADYPTSPIVDPWPFPSLYPMLRTTSEFKAGPKPASGTQTATISFAYPLYDRAITVSDAQKSDCTQERKAISTACSLLSSVSTDTNDLYWTQNGLNFATKPFDLFINGKYVKPDHSTANIVQFTPAGRDLAPGVSMYFGDVDDQRLPVDVPIDSGTPLRLVVKVDQSYIWTLLKAGTSPMKPRVPDFENPLAVQTSLKMSVTNTDCQFGPWTLKSYIDAGFLQLSISATDPNFTLYGVNWSTGAPVQYWMYTFTKDVTCSFPLSFNGLSTSPLRFTSAGLLATSLYLPQISLSTDSTSVVGILPTRPFFLNQINFGSLRVRNIPADLSSVTFYYRQITFRPAQVQIVCKNGSPDPTKNTFTGTFISRGEQTAQLLIIFDDPSVALIRETAVNYPDLSCSSIPLMVTRYYESVGLQFLATTSSRFSQVDTNFPSTFAMQFASKLSPGRVSTINFTIRSSIPGTWMIQAPYAVDLTDDPHCRSESGEVLLDVEFHSHYSLSASECDATDIAPADCYDQRLVFIMKSYFQTNTVNDPKSCTFSAVRRYSSEPGQRSTGTLRFLSATSPVNPDPSDTSFVAGELSSLWKYKTSVLFPSIGFLQPTINFQMLNSQLSNTNTAAGQPALLDQIQLEFFNVKMVAGTSYTLTHTEPLDSRTGVDASLSSFSMPCVFSSDISGEVNRNDFVIGNYKIDEANSAYSLSFDFKYGLEVYQRLVCTFPIAYRSQAVRKGQTAVGNGPIYTATSNEQQEYVTYLYLPAVTSAYELQFKSDSFALESTSSASSSKFTLGVRNLVKASSKNAIFVQFRQIGLIGNSDSFSCTSNSQKLPVVYSRESDYTLNIDLDSLPLLPTDTEQTLITCTVKYTDVNDLVITPSAMVTASLFESLSGQYGVATAQIAFVPPKSTSNVAAYAILQFKSPSMAKVGGTSSGDDNKPRIESGQYTARVGQLWTYFSQLFDEGRIIDPTDRLYEIYTTKGPEYRSLLSKIDGSKMELLQRRAYFPRVTSLSDPLAKTGQDISALQIDDIATVALPTLNTFDLKSFRYLQELLDPTAIWWTSSSYGEFFNSALSPFDVPAWRDNWFQGCFGSASTTHCGSNCPLSCPNDSPCKTDFDCTSGFCHADKKVCAEKDFSIFGSDFFLEYTK
jgi:hypothetical protein